MSRTNVKRLCFDTHFPQKRKEGRDLQWWMCVHTYKRLLSQIGVLSLCSHDYKCNAGIMKKSGSCSSSLDFLFLFGLLNLLDLLSLAVLFAGVSFTLCVTSCILLPCLSAWLYPDYYTILTTVISLQWCKWNSTTFKTGYWNNWSSDQTSNPLPLSAPTRFNSSRGSAGHIEPQLALFLSTHPQRPGQRQFWSGAERRPVLCRVLQLSRG